MSISQSIRDTLAFAQSSNQTAEHRLDRVDAQWLLLHTLGKTQNDRAWLLTHDEDLLSGPVMATFEQFCRRRASGEPLAYIVGYKEFFGLQLAVDPRVLVPRPDTETLVEWSLEVLATSNDLRGDLPGPLGPKILDLGTGSGAIAIALAHSLKNAGYPARVSAIDASNGALTVAAGNARRLELAIDFAISHWLAQVDGKYDLIVSNPPYIAQADSHLQALRHEPLSALAAGSDGLDDIREIIKTAPTHLQRGGWLLMEHGYDQAEKVRNLLLRSGFAQIESREDLAGIERCSGGRWLS